MKIRSKEEIASEHVQVAKEIGLKQIQIKQLESIIVQLHAKAIQLEQEWQLRSELDQETAKQEKAEEVKMEEPKAEVKE